jgi:hypothetical protein
VRTEIFFKNSEQIQHEMAGKSKEVQVGYIEKLALKKQISPKLADRLKLITETRYSNLMKSTSGPDPEQMRRQDEEDSFLSHSTLKKVRLELKPTVDEETDRVPSNTLKLLGGGAYTQKSSKIPLIRDCCVKLKAKRGEPYTPGARHGGYHLITPRSISNTDVIVDDSGEGVISLGSGDLPRTRFENPEYWDFQEKFKKIDRVTEEVNPIINNQSI